MFSHLISYISHVKFPKFTHRVYEFFTCEVALRKGGGECLYLYMFACVIWQCLFEVQLIIVFVS